MIAPTPAPAPIFPASPLDAFAFERLGDRGAERIVAAVDRDLIEGHRHAALPLDAAGLGRPS